MDGQLPGNPLAIKRPRLRGLHAMTTRLVPPISILLALAGSPALAQAPQGDAEAPQAEADLPHDLVG